MKIKNYNPKITVCSKCLRSCCWRGEFMCDDAVEASTEDLDIATLIKIQDHLNGTHVGEHPDYWNHALQEMGEPMLTAGDLIRLGMKPDPDIELDNLADDMNHL